MSLKVLIVGGSGNLGTKICKFFLKPNYKLINLDKKKLKNFDKVNFINFDLTKKINKNNLPKNINIIIFSAGHIGGLDSLKNDTAEKYFKYNLYTLSNLLENIQNSKLKKIVFFSSEQVIMRGVQRSSVKGCARRARGVLSPPCALVARRFPKCSSERWKGF